MKEFSAIVLLMTVFTFTAGEFGLWEGNKTNVKINP